MAVNKIVFGDIHGEKDKLIEILSMVSTQDELIFLGDYINHGNDSKKVVDTLIQLKDNFKVTFLAGNHEIYLLQYLKKEISFFDFACIGGLATIKSYLNTELNLNVFKKFYESIPPSHLDFYNELRYYYEDAEYFISHSGINHINPMSRTLKDLTTNTNLKDQNNKLKKVIICGHFPQKKNKPFISENLICIDTGCGKNLGKLTAIKLPDKQIIQST